MEDKFYKDLLNLINNEFSSSSILDLDHFILNYNVKDIPYFAFSDDGVDFKGTNDLMDTVTFYLFSPAYNDMQKKVNEFIKENYQGNKDLSLTIFRNSWMYVQKYYPLVGKVLSQLKVEFDKRVPTLGVMYSNEKESYVMLVNPNFVIQSAAMSILSKYLIQFSNTDDFNKTYTYIEKNIERLAENGLKFLILHEAYHIIETHVDSSQGKKEVTNEENVVQDHQINKKLGRVLGEDTPDNIKIEGVNSGFMFYYNLDKDKVKDYINNVLGKDESEIDFHDFSGNESIEEVFFKIFNYLNRAGDFKYLYVNLERIRNDFNTSYDRLIEILNNIKSLTVSNKMKRRSKSLSDVIKENLDDNDFKGENKEIKNVKENGGFLYAESNDLDVQNLIHLENPYNSDAHEEDNPIGLYYIKTHDSEKWLRADVATNRGVKNLIEDKAKKFVLDAPEFADKNLALKNKQLILIEEVANGKRKVVVFNDYTDTSYVSDTAGYGVIFKAYDPSIGDFIYVPSAVVKKVYSEPPYFKEGDRVQTKTGVIGKVTFANPSSNSYEIEDDKTGDIVTARAQNMKFDTWKSKFKVGSPIVIKQGRNTGKIGVIKEVPDTRDGEYKVDVLSDETAKSLLDSMEKHERKKMEDTLAKYN